MYFILNVTASYLQPVVKTQKCFADLQNSFAKFSLYMIVTRPNVQLSLDMYELEFYAAYV